MQRGSMRQKSAKKQREAIADLAFLESGWRDLNPRPFDPQSNALPSCATTRWAAEYTASAEDPKLCESEAIGRVEAAHRSASVLIRACSLCSAPSDVSSRCQASPPPFHRQHQLPRFPHRDNSRGRRWSSRASSTSARTHSPTWSGVMATSRQTSSIPPRSTVDSG